MPTQEHRDAAGKPVLRVAVITLSDTRTPETDKSGQLMKELLTAAGHTIGHYSVMPDEPEKLRQQVRQLADEQAVEVILTNGGTGISRRDSTFEALAALLEKQLDGFGELFRMLSFPEIGPAAMLSRAMAGVYRGLLVFSTPGSPHAVRLAMEKLILPELPHLVWEIKK